MGLESGLVKKLLLIACILGVLQGLLTLVGGIIACFDRDKSVIFKSHCSSMTPMMDLKILDRIRQMVTGTLTRRILKIVGHRSVNARLIRRIEVGLRESIKIVRILRILRTNIMVRMVVRVMLRVMLRVALQDIMPLNLLCLLLLYVVFFGF